QQSTETQSTASPETSRAHEPDRWTQIRGLELVTKRKKKEARNSDGPFIYAGLWGQLPRHVNPPEDISSHLSRLPCSLINSRSKWRMWTPSSRITRSVWPLASNLFLFPVPAPTPPAHHSKNPKATTQAQRATTNPEARLSLDRHRLQRIGGG